MVKDPANRQPAVGRICHVILSAYTRSNKNETNKANKAKSDQPEYKEEGEGEEARVRGTKCGAPDDDTWRDWSGPSARRRGRPAPPAPRTVVTAPTTVAATATTAAAATVLEAVPAVAPLCQQNSST